MLYVVLGKRYHLIRCLMSNSCKKIIDLSFLFCFLAAYINWLSYYSFSTFFIYKASMPRTNRSAAQLSILAQARAEKKSEAPISEVSIETVVTSPTYSVEQLSKAEKKIAVLESALQAEKQTSAKLLKMLEAEKEKCDRLSDKLDA